MRLFFLFYMKEIEINVKGVYKNIKKYRQLKNL